MKLLSTLTRMCGRSLFWLGVIAIVGFALVALIAKYVVMPNIARYQPEIVGRVAAASGMEVTAGAIRGSWRGFRPVLDLEQVVFSEPRSSKSTDRPAGQAALILPGLTASLSWWSLLAGQIEFGEITLREPELMLSRRKDGLIYFAGQPINQRSAEKDDGQLLQWLAAQPAISISHAALTWQDEITPGPDLRFTDVNLRVERADDGHALGFVATPPAGVAKHVEARGKVRLDSADGRWLAVGTLYAAVSEANLDGIRSQLAVPRALQTGIGNVRLWADIDNAAMASTTVDPNAPWALLSPVRMITADINLINGRAQFADDAAPLNLAKLAGRVQYAAKEGGFTASSKDLEFRTRDGAVSPPADFSLTLLHQQQAATASGEISGNDIDLKVMTGVLEYFPIGKELRATFARLGLRGAAKNARVAWKGYADAPSAYTLTGALRDFGINAQAETPGVTGFSGTVEGDQKGGKFVVAAKKLTLDAPAMFAAPLKFESVDSNGVWQVSEEAVTVDIANLVLANEDLALNLAGRYSRFRADGPRAKEELGPGSLDIKGKLTRASAARVPAYFPNGIAPTREYISWAVRGGEVESADFALKGAIYHFPFHQGKGGKYNLDAKLKNVDFRYAEGWPQVDKIHGLLSFENTRIAAQFTSASIFGANLGATTLNIDDTTREPGLLTIKSDIDARAEEVTRFLRESPLAKTIGSFSKFVTIEGPGKLALGLNITLGEKVRTVVDGRYTLAKAQAKPIFGPIITNLSGTIAFGEAGITTTGLQGTAYGNPVTLAVNSSGDDGVTTDFKLRADLKDMGNVLPITLPQQITGTTDFIGKIVTRKAGTDVTIDSGLAGVEIALPTPLTKAASEKRALNIQINNVSEANERIRVTLAGMGNDLVESRIDARFQRRFDGADGAATGLFGGIASIGEAAASAVNREGIWLTGALAKLDFDQWRRAVFAFYPASNAPPASAPATARGNTIAGFDFKLGGLIAYGREFSAMSLKGRHAGQDWRLTAESAEASGDILWRPTAYGDRGSVRARLKNLVLVDQVVTLPATPAPLVEPAVDEALPAVDLVADEFTLKGKWLGRLDLSAVPQGANWRIERFNITNGHAKLEMDGLWQRYGDPAQAPQAGGARSRTTMKVRLESPNLNALLGQFGFQDYMRGGIGTVEGNLVWPGHAYQFSTSTFSGKLAIHATKGAFEKVNPKGAKLLGLLNMQELQRRVLFDFRDVFSQGYEYDKMHGDVNITNGVMRAEKFEIAGSVAHISMTGEVSIPTEQTNLVITVVPKVGSTLAVGAGVATANPLVGLLVLGFQRLAGNPLDKAFGYKLAVTGVWDDPKVDEIRSGEAAPPAPVTSTEKAPDKVEAK